MKLRCSLEALYVETLAWALALSSAVLVVVLLIC